MKYYLLVSFLVCITLTACHDDGTTDLSINFKLRYQDAPLVMLQEYTYPDGRTIRFSRISFYLSDIRVTDGRDELSIKDAEMVNLSASHADMNGANNGLSLSFEEIPLEQINTLKMNIGLTEEQNKKVPADYESGHPLSQSGEYWIGWKSYIFAKIEGFIDLDKDGVAESTFALHLGSDPIRRAVQFTQSNAQSDLVHFDFSIDMSEVFSNGEIYDIVTTPNIHSLAQIDQATFLINNLAEAMHMDNL